MVASFILCGVNPGALPASQSIDAWQDADAIKLSGLIEESGSNQRDARSETLVTRAVRIVPACEENDPALTEPVNALCPEAVILCQKTPEPDVMYWIFTGPPGVAEPGRFQWERTGQRCMRETETRSPDLPAFTVEDFRRLPLPEGRVRVQPPGGQTLVNISTNVFALAKPVTLPTTLLGFPVSVRARPVEYRWAFGDGGRLATSDPGHPYPDMTTTHVYRSAGRRRLVLTTVYEGEYSVSGGPWLPVEGQAMVVSPVVEIDVLEASSHLVADLLT